MKFTKIIAGLSSAVIAASMMAAIPSSALTTENPPTGGSIPKSELIRVDHLFADSQLSPGSSDNPCFSTVWTAKVGNHITFDLSSAPQELRDEISLVWYTNNTFAPLGDWVTSTDLPSTYAIEVNDAPGGGDEPTSGWEDVTAVSGNVLASRMHSFDFEGYNWIRLTVDETASYNKTTKEMDYNYTDGTAKINIGLVHGGMTDSWLFIGDSITAGGMGNNNGSSFSYYINKFSEGAYSPIQINAGIGGLTSNHGKNNIKGWLKQFPGRYVSIAYGTNDCWGNPNNTKTYHDNLAYMIQAIHDAGKTVVLPKIPFSTNPDVANNLPAYNAIIDQLYEEYPYIIKGPDFYSIMKADPEGFFGSGDGVHPDSNGYQKMRKAWAELMYTQVYHGTIINPGDINGDGKVNVKDAMIAIQMYFGKIKKPTDAQMKAADLDGDGKVSNKEVLKIIAAAKGKITLDY